MRRALRDPRVFEGAPDGLGPGERRQPAGGSPGGGLAGRDGLGCAGGQRGGVQPGKIGLDQHVARPQFGQRALRVLLGEQVDHLLRHAQRAAELADVVHRRADVHHDQHLGAQRARQVHRDVAHQPAVDQEAPLMRQRREQARHRQRRAQRHGQRRLVQLDQFAGAQVGRHRPEGDPQAAGRALRKAGRDQLLERPLQRVAAHRRGRPDQATARAEPELQPRRLLVLGFAHAEVAVPARRPVGEHGRPVGAGGEALELGGRAPRRVGAADHRAHAGAHHDVDRHAQLLQHAQHADVREAPRPATRQHQPNARAPGGRRRIGRSGTRALGRGRRRQRSVGLRPGRRGRERAGRQQRQGASPAHAAKPPQDLRSAGEGGRGVGHGLQRQMQ